MAITEETYVDKIEILPELNVVQVRRVTVIKRDGVVIASTNHRSVFDPLSDITQEDAVVKTLCESVFTPEVRAAHEKAAKEQQGAAVLKG